MASNTDVVKKLYYNMGVLCLYLCVCMSVAKILFEKFEILTVCPP